MTEPLKENAPAATEAIFKTSFYSNSNYRPLPGYSKQFMTIREACNGPKP